ncbi:GDSL-type esterase/lipase family protein [Bacteroides ovatus]|nr:GDSL-type esterase/lipase family protein [Bacteroides ovatus]
MGICISVSTFSALCKNEGEKVRLSDKQTETVAKKKDDPKTMKSVRERITLKEGEKVRIACVGNSITAGSGIKDAGKNGYPAQLNRLLGAKYKVQNCGASGATMMKTSQNPWMYYASFKDGKFAGVDYAKNSNHFQKALDMQPHVVIIKLGTNDSKKDYWDAHKDEFESEMQLLIDKFKENGKAKGIKPVFYLCYPSKSDDKKQAHGVRNFIIEQEIIPRINALAKKNRLNVIDLHYDLLNPTDDTYFWSDMRNDPYKNDGLHPNKKGAGELAKKIKETLDRTLTVKWK